MNYTNFTISALVAANNLNANEQHNLKLKLNHSHNQSNNNHSQVSGQQLVQCSNQTLKRKVAPTTTVSNLNLVKPISQQSFLAAQLESQSQRCPMRVDSQPTSFPAHLGPIIRAAQASSNQWSTLPMLSASQSTFATPLVAKTLPESFFHQSSANQLMANSPILHNSAADLFSQRSQFASSTNIQLAENGQQLQQASREQLKSQQLTASREIDLTLNASHISAASNDLSSRASLKSRASIQLANSIDNSQLRASHLDDPDQDDDDDDDCDETRRRSRKTKIPKTVSSSASSSSQIPLSTTNQLLAYNRFV